MAKDLLLIVTAVCSLLATTASAQSDAALASTSDGSRTGLPHKSVPGYYHAVVVAHAILASLAWVIFFPLGSILMRLLSGKVAFRVHAYIQLFGILLYVAGVGTGIWISKTTHKLETYHPIIGLAIFGLMILQVAAGMFHHWILYKKYLQRTHIARIHLWTGRILVTLGMINGGLGLKLAAPDYRYGVRVASKGELALYGIVCGLVWLTYVLIVSYKEMESKHNAGTDLDSEQTQIVGAELSESKA